MKWYQQQCGGQRGCGSRVEGGTYACVSLSPFGKPVEHFVLDPPKPWAGKPFRSPLFAQRKDGVFDLVVWVGEESYPFAPDFLEEVRVKGISRQLSSKAPMGKLTAMESRMVLVHANAIAPVEFTEMLSGVPPAADWCKCPGAEHSCTYALWPLSALGKVSEKHEVEVRGEVAQATCPVCSYQVQYPWNLDDDDAMIVKYEPGAFAAFYITHFETVSQEGKADPVVVEQCKLAGYELLICTE